MFSKLSVGWFAYSDFFNRIDLLRTINRFIHPKNISVRNIEWHQEGIEIRYKNCPELIRGNFTV